MGAEEPFVAALPHSKAGQGGEGVGLLLLELAGSRSRVSSGGWSGMGRVRWERDRNGDGGRLLLPESP